MFALDPGVTVAIISGCFGIVGTTIGLYYTNRARKRAADAQSSRGDQRFLRDIIHEQREELDRKDARIASLEAKVDRLEQRLGGVRE